MTSQKKLILAHLRRGKTMTKKQGLELFGVWNSGARILELRQAGHNIKTVMLERLNRHGDIIRFAQYSLEK